MHLKATPSTIDDSYIYICYTYKFAKTKWLAQSFTIKIHWCGFCSSQQQPINRPFSKPNDVMPKVPQ
jgi:hypothetical protein